MLRRRNGEHRAQAGPVWPPVDAAPVDAMPVRVVRETHEVIEAVGTPEQIRRSGLTAPGGEALIEDGPVSGAGQLPAGGGGLMKDLFVIVGAVEFWLARFVQRVLLAGARCPRLVLWGCLLMWAWAVTS